MPTSPPDLDSLPQTAESRVISASCLRLSLPQPLKCFFRHGWHSWTLTTWLDPSDPPLPVRAAEFRVKDEDPAYALAKNHVSAWVGAVELGENDILLLGALDLGGRVELDGLTLNGFYESVERDTQSVSLYNWFIARGTEENVFSKYAALLEAKFGKGRFEKAPRVWCSWYSLLGWIHERTLLGALRDFGDMPFDVFQIDDGWQVAHGDWEANAKFPSGMKAIAEKISATGRTAGIWLSPFMVSPGSQLVKDHPNWLLRDEKGAPVRGGITWSGNEYSLDASHPEVLEWLAQLIRKVRGWGYGYLKLDFLYIGALIGKRYKDLPREVIYRNAMQVLRESAGDAYILACGAPLVPSLGLCDGMRVGPDVAPFWLNKPLSVWLNNPNDTSTQNSIRTSLHRLWLSPLVNVDPDVIFFRSKYNSLEPDKKKLLQDLGTISGFKATSDLPQWLSVSEKEALRAFLESTPVVRKKKRYVYQIDGRSVDFSAVMPIPSSNKTIPVWLAKNLGLLKIVSSQALPAIWESMKKR
ncbi:MAG TPA: glycoside hydrolase family 36 protein [Anaerolineales bacterium]|nr:glycoside hydrolase family 36 protein [Anaerolineales bacterium]